MDIQVLFGPMVQLYPPGHPLDPERRDGLNGPEFARDITIGDDCWIGGGAIIMGKVYIFVARPEPMWAGIDGGLLDCPMVAAPSGKDML